MLFLGSSCVYPRECPQPMREEYLLTGKLEPTNEYYAIAKIAGIKLCEAYWKQYQTKFFAVLPPNLYGPHDNFSPDSSHVLAALLRKFHMAKINDLPQVEIWGTGSPKREFLYVEDLAEGLVFLMNTDASYEYINIGTGTDISIKDLAILIQEIVDYEGEFVFNKNYPDGMPRKVLDISRIRSLGWKPKTTLREGIKRTYEWFIREHKNQ